MTEQDTPAGAPAPAERAAYRRAIVATCVLAVVGLAAAGAAWLLAESGAAVAIAAGVAVGTFASLASQVATLRSAGAPAHVFGAVVAGAWLGKMVVIVAALAVLAQIDGFARAPFGIALLVTVIVNALIDLFAVRSARIPHVQPGSKSGVQ